MKKYNTIFALGIMVSMLGIYSTADASSRARTCNRNQQPIVVTSPNGGTFSGGQRIKIKWKTCNVTSSGLVNIDLALKDADGNYSNAGSLSAQTENDGSQMVTLPSVTPSRNYAIHIDTITMDNLYASDISNKTFMIR